jgi:hypothetical protein
MFPTLKRAGKEKRKMKKSAVLAIIVSVLLGVALTSVRGVGADLADVKKPMAALVNEPVTSSLPAGGSGSGWKPDVSVATTTNTELDPSIGSYVNPGSGAVTLYAAYVWYNPDSSKYDGRIARSFNQGATWATWWDFWYGGGWSVNKPSLAVNCYNNTVFVAVEDSPSGGGARDITVWRFTAAGWASYNVDWDADDDNSPRLTVEYSFATNFLFVSYEKQTSSDDIDLYVATSSTWGLTWSSTLLRGGALDSDVYHLSDITYAQGNVYIAYRHSTNWNTIGHIDVSYSLNYGATWNHVENVSQVSTQLWVPSVAGSRIGPWHQPTTVIVAYYYAATPANYDILYAWSRDYGVTWIGGNGYFNQIAVSADNEYFPEVAVDGMGTENTNVGGNFHLVYLRNGNNYYTQLQYWDLPIMLGPTPWAYYLGWSTPHGLTNDVAGSVLGGHTTITTYTRTVGGDTLWEPAIAWNDWRNSNWDIYYTTPGTDFSLTFVPSSQTVVAGKSLSYYLTVNLLSGPTAPAYLSGTNWPWIILGTNYAVADYSVSPISPTVASTLTVHTSNLMPVGGWNFDATATIGGYRRIVSIPFTVVAAPTLTLNLSPTTVARGAKLTLSGQLTPSLGSVQTIYIYYRYPHQTGTWKLATTLSTNAAGAYSVTATVPLSLTPGLYDLVAYWVNTANGAYATSPIKVVRFT